MNNLVEAVIIGFLCGGAVALLTLAIVSVFR